MANILAYYFLGPLILRPLPQHLRAYYTKDSGVLHFLSRVLFLLFLVACISGFSWNCCIIVLEEDLS